MNCARAIDRHRQLTGKRPVGEVGRVCPLIDDLAMTRGCALAWQFRVLGSLEVCCDGVPVPTGPAKQKCVLTALLLEHNRVVPVDRLVSAVWGNEPPRSSMANIRTYASRLRAVLTGRAQRSLLHSRPPGYLLAAEEEELDLALFHRHTTSGRAASRAGRLPEAEAEFRLALRLWRGAAAEDLSRASGLGGRLTALNEQRLAVLEEWIETRQLLGEHGALIGELRQLTIDHPLRERFWHQLIVSLYRTGDVGGALQACAQARVTLVDQLGLDPGPGLTELHRAVLARDPELILPAISNRPGNRDRVTSGSVGVPRELPPASSVFVGRAAETAEALSVVRDRDAPSLLVVGGPIGVGKSAFATHVAHRLAGSFPDGQIFVDLHGPAGRMAARRPVEVLARMLRALGVPDQQVPRTEEESAASFRSLTTGRQLLFVLDNARDEEQLRPLLPGTAGCGVLVTSRKMLAGLDDAHHIELDRLSQDAGVVLLGRLCGEDRVAADPEHAHRVVALCDRLPVALRAAGNRLAERGRWSIADLAEQLADERHRLDNLACGGVAVRPRLECALRELTDPGSRRMFRLLGLLRLAEVSKAVVGALMDLPGQRVEPFLDQLTAVRLLEQTAPDRYRMDSLVRLYAADLAEAHERPESRAAAIDRVLDLESVNLAALARPYGSPAGDLPMWRRRNVSDEDLACIELP